MLEFYVIKLSTCSLRRIRLGPTYGGGRVYPHPFTNLGLYHMRLWCEWHDPLDKLLINRTQLPTVGRPVGCDKRVQPPRTPTYLRSPCSRTGGSKNRPADGRNSHRTQRSTDGCPAEAPSQGRALQEHRTFKPPKLLPQPHCESFFPLILHSGRIHH